MDISEKAWPDSFTLTVMPFPPAVLFNANQAIVAVKTVTRENKAIPVAPTIFNDFLFNLLLLILIKNPVTYLFRQLAILIKTL